MRARWLMVVAGLLLAGRASSTAGEDTDVGVINAAMRSFYTKNDWTRYDWNEGRFIVVMARYWGSGRHRFAEALANLAEWARLFKIRRGIALLRAVRRSVRPLGYEPGPIRPLKDLVLDSRVIVTDETVKSTWGQSRDAPKQTFVNRFGRRGDVRAAGQLSPPCYSGDGRYAILNMSGMTWSGGFHGAEILFLLKHGSRGWGVIYVTPLRAM